MLWHKAWIETRARFLVSLFGILTICSYSVFHGDKEALSYARTDYYYSVLHGSHALLAVTWTLAVVLLMSGGLLRERALGASLFTLALPIRRSRLVAVRISVGLVQAILLGLLPWSAMFFIGSVTGKADSMQQAFFHVLLLLGGGAVFFAIALLVSSLIEGEYTAPSVSFGIVMATAAAINSETIRSFSPWAFMMGAEFFDRRTSLLIGPIPWIHVAAYLAFSALLIALSMKVTERTEF